MKKKIQRRLALNRETLSNLDRVFGGIAVNGDVVPVPDSKYVSCTYVNCPDDTKYVSCSLVC